MGGRFKAPAALIRPPYKGSEGFVLVCRPPVLQSVGLSALHADLDDCVHEHLRGADLDPGGVKCCQDALGLLGAAGRFKALSMIDIM